MKLTLSNLNKYTKTVVLPTKQAAAYASTTNNFAKLVDKIGKIVTIDGGFNDKLTEMDGEELPYGKTIEEYFVDLTLPEAFTDYATEGAKNDSPNLPSVEECAYSYTLGKSKVKTTVPYNDYERACNSASDAANLSTKIIERLDNSDSLKVYAMKKQLLANVITKVGTTASLITTIAAPTDAETGEAFLVEVKKRIEDASFASEGNNLGNYLIGEAPSLVLYVKKGIVPDLEVRTLAGAFHDDKLALNCRIEVVDDFGNDTSDTYAILMDPRMVKLHPTYKAVRTHENADGDFVNFVKHSEYTGFISKSTYIHTFKSK